MTLRLQANEEFQGWLGVDGGIISKAASRLVTLAILTVVWSAAREHGRFVGVDLVLEKCDLGALDSMAAVPGVGCAMTDAGWAVWDQAADTVTLPNFKRYNVPMTQAERAKQYRSRRRQEPQNNPSRPVTPRHAPSRSREEKSREEDSARFARGAPAPDGPPPDGLFPGVVLTKRGSPSVARRGTPQAELVEHWQEVFVRTRSSKWAAKRLDYIQAAQAITLAEGDLAEAKHRATLLLEQGSDGWLAKNASLAVLVSHWNTIPVEVIPKSYAQRERDEQSDILKRGIAKLKAKDQRRLTDGNV